MSRGNTQSCFSNGASSGVSCNGLPAKDPIAKIMQAADALASGAPQSDGMTPFILPRALAFGPAALTDAVFLQLLHHSIETGIASFKPCFTVPAMSRMLSWLPAQEGPHSLAVLATCNEREWLVIGWWESQNGKLECRPD